MDVEGILRVSGSTHQQKQLQKLYLKRKNPDLSQVGIHTVACLLKNYFRDCKDPLLSNQLYDDFLSLCMSSHRSLDSYPSGPRRERGKMRPFSCLFPSSLCSFVVLISLTDHFYFSLSLSSSSEHSSRRSGEVCTILDQATPGVPTRSTPLVCIPRHLPRTEKVEAT